MIKSEHDWSRTRSEFVYNSSLVWSVVLVVSIMCLKSVGCFLYFGFGRWHWSSNCLVIFWIGAALLHFAQTWTKPHTRTAADTAALDSFLWAIGCLRQVSTSAGASDTRECEQWILCSFDFQRRILGGCRIKRKKKTNNIKYWWNGINFHLTRPPPIATFHIHSPSYSSSNALIALIALSQLTKSGSLRPVRGNGLSPCIPPYARFGLMYSKSIQMETVDFYLWFGIGEQQQVVGRCVRSNKSTINIRISRERNTKNIGGNTITIGYPYKTT